MKDLPRHPVFEIAEQTPVFLVGDKVYSLGEGTPREGENFYEQTERKGIIKKLIRGKKITRTSLIEVGDFGYLESLTLDRGQLQLEKIGESYVKEVQKDFLGRLEGDLDVPQLIYKHVFPYLRDGEYRDKVFELIGLEENRAVVPGPQIKTEVTKNLEQIADEIGVEVEGLIRRIEEEGQGPVGKKERTPKQSLLDVLLDYKEQASYTGTSLLGKALNGKAVAIVEGVVYNLVTPNDRYDKHVQIDGQRFSLVEREQKKEPKKDFEVGDEVLGKKNYENKKLEGIRGRIVGVDRYISVEWEKYIGGHECDGLAKQGHGWNVPKENLIALAEIVKNGATPKDLEDRFLAELGKKVRVDALRQHLSRDKVIDMLRTQDPELLAIAGKKEHQEEGFGFTFKNGGYYVYLEVPAFAIKSQYDGNHYLFDKTRIGIKVWKNKRTFKNSELLVMIDNIHHPMTEQNRSYQNICIGDNDLPTSGKDVGEVITKRLMTGREIVMHGYTKGGFWFNHRRLGICNDCGINHYKKHIISEEKAKSLNIPIADGERL
jgi:hypothetical protein